jgi:hypothetical protein
VQEIDVHPVWQNVSAPVSLHITDPSQVERIVAWFNALSRWRERRLGEIRCGDAAFGRPLTFVFRAANGANLGMAFSPANPTSYCDPIGFTAAGQPDTSETSLLDRSGTNSFLGRVGHLLGVSFSGRYYG